VLIACLLGAGCQAEPPPPDAAAPMSDESPRAGSPAPAATVIPIRLGSWEEVEQLVASQSGKVVVLDVWSTWCVPCLREFPGLVALHEKYGDQVACVSLNCNYTGAAGETPEDARREIEKFLREKEAEFENVISTTPDEELYKILGAAAIPVVRVYDKQGEMRKQFVNDDNEYGDEGFRYEQHIQPLVEQLLAE
jgi:thiol-disulfide isomerase/thioredoxin